MDGVDGVDGEGLRVSVSLTGVVAARVERELGRKLDVCADGHNRNPWVRVNATAPMFTEAHMCD